MKATIALVGLAMVFSVPASASCNYHSAEAETAKSQKLAMTEQQSTPAGSQTPLEPAATEPDAASQDADD
jgi:hypothetical protein